jgi:uncharacterized protein YodC (DUF2158 family)
MQRRKFDLDDLVPVKGEHVVLASGGPLMRVECVEGDRVICAWDEWEGDWLDGKGVKTVHRADYGINSVRKLSNVTKEELEAMAPKQETEQ